MLKALFEKIPRYFFLFFVVFFVTAFFAFYESFRQYEAEADVLVLSKSEAIGAETAARTLAEFPETLAFYERLIADHDMVEDPWIEASKSDRKRWWNEVLESKVLPGTSLIHLSVSSANVEQSSALLNASLETLYGFSGRLYDREKQVDIRLVEGVIARPVLRMSWALLLLSGVFAGVLAFLVSLLFRVPLRRVTLPAFPSRRVSQIFASTKASETIRPVGAFPDIDRGEETFFSEESKEKGHVKGEEERRGETETLAGVAVNDSWGIESSLASEVVAKPASISAPDETPSPISFFEKRPGDPDDIWEKSRISIVTQTSKRESLSPSSLGVSRESAAPAVAKPGTLETIPAGEFTWEKYLFQNGGIENDSKERDIVKTSVEEVNGKESLPEKREPTPEELKARLNQLLRGEL